MAAERAMPVAEANDDDLIDASVDRPPHRPDPGDARLAGSGYPVRFVIDARARPNAAAFGAHT